MIEEKGINMFLKMDRTLHQSVNLRGEEKGRRYGHFKGKVPKKKYVFKARPAPPRPAPEELARRAEEYAAKKNPKIFQAAQSKAAKGAKAAAAKVN